MSVSVGGRKFISELNGFVDKTVKVITTRGVSYEGKLLGFDGSNLSVCLEDATVNKEKFARAIIRGEAISEILLKEKPFDMKGLSDRLQKLFPNMVKYYEDAGFITVMDRIRVTPEGVEGTGPMVERVKKVYEQHVLEQKSA
ncbi:MAG: Lsm family RNA-binding protein [Candidatus Methanosuratincola sp.]|jgi:small nuclear ribonucleoprotein (snRNP)-like protein|nr:Lsm family RNA-binding protein [Candidatus Methanosuratincola sp.]